MRDPDTGLHMEYLPLYASVPIARLEQAWEWAKLSDHPECRYAAWAIAQNHAIAPRSIADHDVPSLLLISIHLSTVWRVYGEFESGGLRSPAEPGLARFHCELTRAGEAWGHPEARMLVYRILAARAAHAEASGDARAALERIWNPAKRLKALLDESPEFSGYPEPRLRSLFTAEEVVCREALCWARGQPEGAEAFRLWTRLRDRTDRLEAGNKLGKPMGTKTAQKSYVMRKGWYRKIAALYLESRARRVV